MLDILTEDYRDGVLPQTAAAAAAQSGNGGVAGEVLSGLPAEECAAAVDGGSTAVADMRNVPPRDGDGSSPRTPQPRSAGAAAQGQQQQQQQVCVWLVDVPMGTHV